MTQKICVLTDTSCTLSASEAKSHGISLLPLNVIDQAGNDLLNTLENKDIGARMVQNELFKTSTTPFHLLINLIEDLLMKYDQVIYLVTSSKISSQYSQCSNLLKDEFPANKVLVYDSLTSGHGLSTLAIQVAHQVKQPNFQIDQIETIIETFDQKHFDYFTCENVKYIARSGRGSKKLLKYFSKIIRPIILFKNENNLESISRTLNGAIEKMVDLTFKRLSQMGAYKIKNVLIYNGLGTVSILEKLIKLVAKKLNFQANLIKLIDVPQVVFVHTGPETYGIHVELQ
ncbi:DegV family protein [[Mycoplasma] cavipharyngis]|uniref:DegV family protein n=1 Tax=[Mycoplasma] cavipharyngis TaxID=92757 RepID=UPI003703AEAC